MDIKSTQVIVTGIKKKDNILKFKNIDLHPAFCQSKGNNGKKKNNTQDHRSSYWLSQV